MAHYEEDQIYKQVIDDTNGKTYDSAPMLFKAVFPHFKSSTIRNYLNVGRTIYLPAERGELSDDLKILAEYGPGTALSACGALNDAEVCRYLPDAIQEAISESRYGRLTQSALKKAVQKARKKSRKDER